MAASDPVARLAEIQRLAQAFVHLSDVVADAKMSHWRDKQHMSREELERRPSDLPELINAEYAALTALLAACEEGSEAGCSTHRK